MSPSNRTAGWAQPVAPSRKFSALFSGESKTNCVRPERGIPDRHDCCRTSRIFREEEFFTQQSRGIGWWIRAETFPTGPALIPKRPVPQGLILGPELFIWLQLEREADADGGIPAGFCRSTIPTIEI